MQYDVAITSPGIRANSIGVFNQPPCDYTFNCFKFCSGPNPHKRAYLYTLCSCMFVSSFFSSKILFGGYRYPLPVGSYPDGFIALLCLSVAACGNRHSGRIQTPRTKNICLHQQVWQHAAKNNRPCACSCRSNPAGDSCYMCLMPYHFSSTVISVRFSVPSTRRSTKSILPKLSSSMIPALTSPSSIIFPL